MTSCYAKKITYSSKDLLKTDIVMAAFIITFVRVSFCEDIFLIFFLSDQCKCSILAVSVLTDFYP